MKNLPDDRAADPGAYVGKLAFFREPPAVGGIVRIVRAERRGNLMEVELVSLAPDPRPRRLMPRPAGQSFVVSVSVTAGGWGQPWFLHPLEEDSIEAAREAIHAWWHQPPAMPPRAEPMMVDRLESVLTSFERLHDEELRACEAFAQGKTPGNPLDSLRARCAQSRAAPFVVWNLGGAQDFTPITSLLTRASPGVDLEAGARPLLYVVSDVAQQIIVGLDDALRGRYSLRPQWAKFDQRVDFAPDQLRRFQALSDQELREARRAGRGGAHGPHPRIHVSVLHAEPDGRPTTVLYLHMSNLLAWHKVVRHLKGVDVLYSTRRGCRREDLQPGSGKVWNAIAEAPEAHRPKVWSVDEELFTPPETGRLIRRSRGYGKPGLWMAD